MREAFINADIAMLDQRPSTVWSMRVRYVEYLCAPARRRGQPHCRMFAKLVAQVMKSLAETLSSERAKLEGQVDQTDKASTEDLRVALRRYRSFFERLLSL